MNELKVIGLFAQKDVALSTACTGASKSTLLGYLPFFYKILYAPWQLVQQLSVDGVARCGFELGKTVLIQLNAFDAGAL